MASPLVIYCGAAAFSLNDMSSLAMVLDTLIEKHLVLPLHESRSLYGPQADSCRADHTTVFLENLVARPCCTSHIVPPPAAAWECEVSDPWSKSDPWACAKLVVQSTPSKVEAAWSKWKPLHANATSFVHDKPQVVTGAPGLETMAAVPVAEAEPVEEPSMEFENSEEVHEAGVEPALAEDVVADRLHGLAEPAMGFFSTGECKDFEETEVSKRFAQLYCGPTAEIEDALDGKMKRCATERNEEERLAFNNEWAEQRRIRKVHHICKEHDQSIEACKTQMQREEKIKEIADGIQERSSLFSKCLGLTDAEIMELAARLQRRLR